MTSVFCCGAECGVAKTSVTAVPNAHWDFFAGGATGSGGGFTTSSPITGTRSISIVNSATQRYAQTNITFGSGVWVFRFKVNSSTLPAVNAVVGVVGGAANMGAAFRVSDSSIVACDGLTNLGTSGVAVVANTTYSIDVRVNSSANPHVIDVSVNGTPCSQLSFGAAADTTAAAILLGLFGASNSGAALFDDLCVSLTSGDFPLGAGEVYHFVPTADGTHNVATSNDFEFFGGADITNATTTAFDVINDVPLKSGVVAEGIRLVAPPNATDYVEVVYGPAPGISTPTTAPRAVDVICAYASASAGTNHLQLALNDNGTTDDVLNTTVGPGTTATYARKHYATPPTGGAWTVSAGAGNFNNLRMRCLTNDAAPDPWFASTMIEAEFAPVSATPRQSRLRITQAVNRASTY